MFVSIHQRIKKINRLTRCYIRIKLCKSRKEQGKMRIIMVVGGSHVSLELVDVVGRGGQAVEICFPSGQYVLEEGYGPAGTPKKTMWFYHVVGGKKICGAKKDWLFRIIQGRPIKIVVEMALSSEDLIRRGTVGGVYLSQGMILVAEHCPFCNQKVVEKEGGRIYCGACGFDQSPAKNFLRLPYKWFSDHLG